MHVACRRKLVYTVVFGLFGHRWSLVEKPSFEAERLNLSFKYDKVTPVSSSNVQRYCLSGGRIDLLNILRIDYHTGLVVH